MIVVSDTSAISNLAQVDCIFILESLYQEIVIPVKVKEELLRDTVTANKIQDIGWITVRKISDVKLYNEIIQNLDPGEAEAIVLAKELGAALIMIDEKKGRKIAKENGLIIVGILGLLIEAKHEGLILNVKEILDKLAFEVGFRVNPKLYTHVLRMAGESA